MLNVKIAIANSSLTPPFDIEYRCVYPEIDKENDILFGFSRWDGTNLISLDGDSYDVEDEITHYDVAEDASGNKMLMVILDTSPPPFEAEMEEALYEYMSEDHINTDEKTRAKRRHADVRKALRKRNISRTHYGFDYYNNIHQYSKNKIHCSCPLCTNKTNVKKWRGKAHAGLYMHFGTSKERYDKNYKASDRRKIDALKVKEREYSTGEDALMEE